MKKVECKFSHFMPEIAEMLFCSNGTNYGNYKCISSINLKIIDGIGINLKTKRFGKEKNFDVDEICITVEGDEKSEGLAVALIEIGRQLMSEDDVFRDYGKWMSKERGFEQFLKERFLSERFPV